MAEGEDLVAEAPGFDCEGEEFDAGDCAEGGADAVEGRWEGGAGDVGCEGCAEGGGVGVYLVCEEGGGGG